MSKEAYQEKIVAPIEFAEAVEHIPQGEWKLPNKYRDFRNPYTIMSWDEYMDKIFGGVDFYLEQALHGKEIVDNMKKGVIELNIDAVNAWATTYRVIKANLNLFSGKNVPEVIGSIRKGISSLITPNNDNKSEEVDIKNTRAFAEVFERVLYK